MKQSKRLAFTLTELLVVVAIVAILAALATAGFVSAKKSAKTSAAISNLRQSYIALQLYCDDHGGWRSLPSLEEARKVIPTSASCDPSDTWRTRCTGDLSPLVGSFGYLRGAEPFHRDEEYQTIQNLQEWGARVALLISMFHGATIPKYESSRFGPEPPKVIPDRILSLYFDGSIRNAVFQKPQAGVGLSWAAFFLRS